MSSKRYTDYLQPETNERRLDYLFNNMNAQTNELFDVVVFEKATRKIDSVIGKNMRRWCANGSGRNTADLRQQTGREQINDRYECEIVEAGKYQKGDLLP